MPITSDNYQKAEDWLNRAKSDPNADKNKISRMEMELRSYYEGESSGALPKPKPEQPEVRGGKAGYFYEPSLEEFRSNITNPEVQKALGLSDSYKEGYVQPASVDKRSYSDLVNPDEDNGLPATYDPKNLSEGSSEYKKYADYAFKKAQEKDPTVSRYSELEVTQNPFKKALGAVVKYGPSTAGGVEKTVALGIPRRAAATIAGNIPDSAADAAYDPMGAPNSGEYHPEKAERVMKGVKEWESLSPTANEIGQIGGYLLPQAPANAGARALLESSGFEAANAAAPVLANVGKAGEYLSAIGPKNLSPVARLGYRVAGNPFGRAGISGLVGSSVAAGEGAINDIIDNPGISGQELLHNTVPRAVMGGGGGVVGDLVAQGAAKAQRAFEESPRWSPIKNQKDIGGDTNLITGIETTPEVRANVREGALGRENKTPQDIAAMKVAPQIKQSVEDQLASQVSKINKEVEDYTKTPYGMQEHAADPVVDRLLNMADKGTVSMPMSGKVVSANKGSADAIRNNLKEFADFAHVSPEEANAITEKHGGRVLSDRQSQLLGLPQESGKVHVVVPGKFNAEALLKKEDQIARNLRYDTKEGGVDNPVLQEMNLGFKEIRDKFKYPFVERRGANRPTNEEFQVMQKPADITRDTPISDFPEPQTAPPEPNQSSIGIESTEQAPRAGGNSEPAPVAEAMTNPRYQEPSASEYERMQSGENVDKSGNGYQRLLDFGDISKDYSKVAQSREAKRLEELAAGEFGAYKPENPFNASKVQSRQDIIDSLTESEYAGRKADRKVIEDYSAEEAARLDAKGRLEARKAGQPYNGPAKGESAIEQLSASEAPEIASEKPPVEAPKLHISDQRAEDAAKFMETYKDNGGHITKQQLQQKMGWQNKPEYEVDKLVKEGRLEQVPPGQKKLGQVDIEYRVPQKAAGKPVSAFPAEASKQESITSPESAKKYVADYLKGSEKELPNKPSTGAESLIDAKLLQREIEDQAKLEGIESPLKVKDVSHDRSGELTATLDDGTKVYGFSALRRKQHEALDALKEAQKATGSATKEGAHRRVLNYKTGEGSPYENETLANEADRLGIRQQLEEVPATREFPGLRARAFGGGGEGFLNTIKDAVGFRADALFGAIAGEARNPYTALPNTPAGRIQQYLFQQGVPFRPLLEQRGGLGAARFADDIADENRQNKER